MDDSYSSNHGHIYGYATGDASLSNNMVNSTSNTFSPQQTFANQDSFSPTARPRHNSDSSQVSPYATHLPVGHHQAEAQPYLAPHSNNAYAHRSEGMSRGNSHASYHSSTLSGQQFDGSPCSIARNSFATNWSPNGIDMQRSGSLYSNTSTLHSQQLSPNLGVSQARHMSATYLPDQMHVSSTGFSVATQESPPIALIDNPLIDYTLNGIEGFGEDTGIVDLQSSE
jgi:hypothetical protein